MFNKSSAFKIRDSLANVLMNVTPQRIQDFYNELCRGDGEALICEAVSLPELEHALIGDEIAHDYDQYMTIKATDIALFEAVSSTKAALIRTMRAFTRKLNMQLADSGITAGTEDASTPEDDDTASSAGGAEISPVRRIAGVPVVMARIPLSDGQSVTIAFQSPTAQTGQLQATDLLVAFRFLLNKRDITHTVAPQGGVDASLTQVTMTLSKLIERNSPKFAKSQARAGQIRDLIASKQTALEQVTNQQNELVQQGDQLQTELAQQNTELTETQKQLQKQQDINSKLQDELTRLQVIQPEPEPEPTPQPTPTPTPTPTPPAGGVHPGAKKPTDKATSSNNQTTLQLPDLSTLADDDLENFAYHLNVASKAVDETIADLSTQDKERALYNLEYAGDQIRNDTVNETPDWLKQLIQPMLARPEGGMVDIRTVLNARSDSLAAAVAAANAELAKRQAPAEVKKITVKDLALPDAATITSPELANYLLNIVQDVTGLLQDAFTSYQQNDTQQAYADMQSKVSRLINSLHSQNVDATTLAMVADYITPPQTDDKQAALDELRRRHDRAQLLQVAYQKQAFKLEPKPTATSKKLNMPDPTSVTAFGTAVKYSNFLQNLSDTLDKGINDYSKFTIAKSTLEYSGAVKARLENWKREGIPDDLLAQATNFMAAPTGGRKGPILAELQARKDALDAMVSSWSDRAAELKAAIMADSDQRKQLENTIRDAKTVISDTIDFEADSEGEVIDQQAKLEAAIRVLADNGVTGWDDDIEMARHTLATMLGEFRGEITPEDTLGEIVDDLKRLGVKVSTGDEKNLRNNPGLVNDIRDEINAATTAWRNGRASYDTEKDAQRAWAEAKLRGESRPSELTDGGDIFMEYMRREGVKLDPWVEKMIKTYPEARNLAESGLENAYGDPEWSEAKAKELIAAYVEGAVVDNFKEPDNRTEEDKAVETAIETLKEIQRDPSVELGQMREDRQYIRDAIATLKQAGKYDENEALVNQTIDYVAQKMISLARGIH